MRGLMKISWESLPLHIIHDHIGDGILGFWRARDVKIEDLHNVGMMQRCNKLCLAFKTRHKVWIVLQIGVEYFNSNVALQLRIQGLPDLGHATVSQARL